jgi:hypothetical protein
MASTPLYKSLKSNGTTFYAFPGAAEDISAAYQNSNYKMYFSKFALLNFPKQNTTQGANHEPIQFDFENAFQKSVNAVDTTKFSEAIVESLRNYVANHEVVLRESRKNNKDYFYNVNSISTATEKIFWKWCRKLNVIDFEAAIPDDEYFPDLSEFNSLKPSDINYFKEYLWKEREVINWDTVGFKSSEEVGHIGKLEIEFNGETNFKVGDSVVIYNVTNSSIYTTINLIGLETQAGLTFYVDKLLPSTAVLGQRVIFNIDASGLGNTVIPETDGQAELVYNRLIQYIGEITGVSNVQEANRSYTEVYAHIPDHNGMTPDVLFRTSFDENYSPNLTFPIIPSQIQPEIMGSELFNSPIVNSPQNYPGSYFGQFDTLDFTYETSSGDILRRSGQYYGIGGDNNNIVVSSKGLDGLGIDFNTSHYVKMNIPGRRATNFDQFNAIQINNMPPDDFEFNAILWYYTVEDNKGNSTNNLYGISFLDNPSNNNTPGEQNLRFPTYTKLVSNGNQDGTSYAFNLNINFNISNDNPQQAYNPQAINSTFGMDLFNDAMKRLSFVNDGFANILIDHNRISEDIMNIKSLIYSQNDINTINAKIKTLEDIIRLYSTMQISPSETVSVSSIPGAPPMIRLNNIATNYTSVDSITTTNLYNTQGRLPFRMTPPDYQDFLLNIINNDETQLTLPNEDRLLITLTKDIAYKQTMEINISASNTSTENKKLDFYVINDANNPTLLIGNLDFPVFYNKETKTTNSAKRNKDFGFNINLSGNIILSSGSLMTLPIDANLQLFKNSVKVGDTLYVSDLLYGTASIIDFSGQYPVVSVNQTTPEITLDLSNNPTVVNEVTKLSSELPKTIHSSSTSMLSAVPKIGFNKGKRIRVTKVSTSATTPSERYMIEVTEL